MGEAASAFVLQRQRDLAERDGVLASIAIEALSGHDLVVISANQLTSATDPMK